MTAEDFRSIALAQPGAEQGSHMGVEDFRADGRIFATLAYVARGCGVLKLTREQQEMLCEAEPDVFAPVAGGWGRMGMTLIRFGATDRPTLEGVLAMARGNLRPKPSRRRSPP
jgi:hypothetical protein